MIIIDQVITHHKATYSLRVYQFTVRQVEKGGKIVIATDQVITHHTKLNPEDAQNMFILRILLAESGGSQYSKWEKEKKL